jgi:hypothetical protein
LPHFDAGHERGKQTNEFAMHEQGRSVHGSRVRSRAICTQPYVNLTCNVSLLESQDIQKKFSRSSG